MNFKNSKLVASLRLDYNKGDAKALSNLFKTLYGDGKAENFNHSLSLGYNKNLCNHNQLGIWLGRAQRSGSLTERYINRFAVGIDAYELVGNPDLKPETNNQIDLIFTHKKDNIFFQSRCFLFLFRKLYFWSDCSHQTVFYDGTRNQTNPKYRKAYKTEWKPDLIGNFTKNSHRIGSNLYLCRRY